MISPAIGNLLIAEPFMKDDSFKRGVVLLCRYGEDGAFGFVMNKQSGFTLEELVPELAGFKIPVYQGGPVQQDSLFFIHQYPEILKEGQRIMPGVYWGGNFLVLQSALKKGLISSDKIKFFLGYSGWEAGQLEAELVEKAWIVSAGNKRLLFDTEAEQIWRESLLHSGPEYKMLVNYPTDPQLN